MNNLFQFLPVNDKDSLGKLKVLLSSDKKEPKKIKKILESKFKAEIKDFLNKEGALDFMNSKLKEIYTDENSIPSQDY